jgi:predicted nucleic acid-binding protein
MPISKAIIDANIGVYSVLNTPHSTQAVAVIQYCMKREMGLFAPVLWWYEVASVLHRYLFDRIITESIADEALEILFSELTVQPVEDLYRPAFDWASRLKQRSAYDGFYLAAAEHLEAEFWTADQALVNNARQLGVAWIHWMGEITANQ